MELENSTNNGLLKHAENLLADMTPKFSSWAKRVGFKRAGILSPYKTSNGTVYVMSDSIGFSATTIANGYSPASFWKGKLSKAFEWQCFSKDFNELTPFMFLLGNMADEVNSVKFLPFKDKDMPYILMVPEMEDEEGFEKPPAAECALKLKNIVDFKYNENKLLKKFDANLTEGLELASAHLYILSLKLCIEKEIKAASIKDKEITELLIQSITENAQVIMTPLFRAPNCIHIGTGGEIKLALFVADEPDTQLLAYHIARTLTSFISKDSLENILLLPAGMCPNKKGIIDFLQKG